MIKAGYENPEYARELWIMSKRDPLFYINTFVFTFDPRRVPLTTTIPFNTFGFQDEAVYEILWAIYNGHDLLIEKTRDAGASWVIVTCYEHLEHFFGGQSFKLVSRTEDLVDKTDYDDALMWKLDHILANLPEYMLPSVDRTHLKLKNLSNGSLINGVSTTADAGRGGRAGSMLVDEFSAIDEGFELLKATRDITKCRIFNGTPKGTGNAQYALRKTGIRKLRFHWSADPRKNKGLYTSKNGTLIRLDTEYTGTVKILDKTYTFPEEYPFILDGKVRSPWYDNECSRAAHPMEIAQELDIDYLASDFQFFDENEMLRIEKETVRRPFWQGEFDFDSQSLQFRALIPTPKGRLILWVNPDVRDRLPEDLEVVAGIDVSAGTGASNSVFSAINKRTGEDVAEWADTHTLPEDFAKVCAALGKWLNAYLVWDAGGPGSSFGKKLINDCQYTNVYYRTDESTITKRMSDKPGYYFTPANKRDTLSAFRDDMKTGEIIIRSAECIRECREYVHVVATNTVEHSGSRNSVDPTGAGDNHGDRVIAKALAGKLRKLFKTEENKNEKPPLPENCYAARKERRDMDKKEREYW
jgi:hypothetical protein